MSRWDALKLWLHLTPQRFEVPWATGRFCFPLYKWAGLQEATIPLWKLVGVLVLVILPVVILYGGLCAVFDILTMPLQLHYEKRCRIPRERAEKVAKALKPPKAPKLLVYAGKYGYFTYNATDANTTLKAFAKLAGKGN